MTGRQHAAPGLAQQVVVVLDLQLLEQVIQLVEEELHGPEVAVVQLLGEVGRVAAAHLVVHDHRCAVQLRDVLQGQYVGVGDTGPAMEDHEGPFRGGGEGAKEGVPCLAGRGDAGDGEVERA